MSGRPCGFICAALVSLALAGAPSKSPAQASLSAQAVVTRAVFDLSLWGKDYRFFVSTVPAWVRAAEQTVVVAPDLIIGGRAYKAPAAAEPEVRSIRAALLESNITFRGKLGSGGFASTVASPRDVSVRRYGLDGSYRVVIARRGTQLLPSTLKLARLIRALGQPEQTIRRTFDLGEAHPIVLTSYRYGNGAIVYQTWNLSRAPDDVVRVELNTRLVYNAAVESR